MSFDTHNLILPGAVTSADAAPSAGGQGLSDAEQAGIKSRFDQVLQSQTVETPAKIPNETTPPVAAVTPIAPVDGAETTVPALPALIDMLAQAVYAENAKTPTSTPALATTLAQTSPQTIDVTVASESGLTVPTEDATPEGATEAPAPSLIVQALMDALKAAQATGASEATATDSVKPAADAPALDLAAVLMAAQLAQSDEVAADAATPPSDADLDALLKTLPPELQALLQATANPANGQGKAAPPKSEPALLNGKSLMDKAFAGTSAEADTLTAKAADISADPALSAVKDVMATAEAAADAAQPAVAAAQTAQVPTSQSEAQALVNNLSARLNGATAASSASSAATAQAYVMSNQTADNIAALAANIHKRMDGKSMRFDMELRPSDMGRVDVRMEINADGKLSAHLSFDSPVAESEFRGRQDELRRQLEQSGFNLEDGSLSFSSRDQNPQQSGRDSGRDEADQPAVTATAASTQFSRTEDTADDLSGNNWLPGMDGFDSMSGRIALNVRV
ncbi:flagellar hook-length control protein FliK [Asticcacaulis sp. ZE23SCel15]|uniref:flagellar hook-length control protein FliK n=1 Tax=Asticcacaulis sp. ZE23SCel15 TaxID=3059027 RepID=UPI0026602D86|nr:flagellar hook-length control protein FliK [Asticcacaulis sp. ZE23SCel15]WKL57792.1 flagellar hook-length control protein FliK [Asticcacaulis sp. ZE23SCel15]